MERWERDVIELAALLEEELPRALGGFRAAAYQHGYVSEWQGAEGFDQEKVRELLQTAEREKRQANQVLGQQMARIEVLIGRAKRINSNAEYWRRLDGRQSRLRLSLFLAEAEADPDGEQWREAWDRVTKAREQLLETVATIAVPPKPPPRNTIRRRLRRNTIGAVPATPRTRGNRWWHLPRGGPS